MLSYIVEDGTGVTGATTYASVGNFLAYWVTTRGLDDSEFDGKGDKIQGSLVRATDFIEGRFRHLFPGESLTTTQGLWYPVKGHYDDRGVELTGVPDLLIAGTCEYALRAFRTPDHAVSPDPQVTDSGQPLKSIRTDEIETVFQDGRGVRTIRPMPSADRLIRRLIGNLTGGTIR